MMQATLTIPPSELPYELHVLPEGVNFSTDSFITMYEVDFPFTAEDAARLEDYLRSKGWIVTTKWENHIEWWQADVIPKPSDD
jgi:hypothetical protein